MTELKIARPFELKALDEDGSFSGYASVFEVQDSYKDIVAPGAFETSLRRWKTKGRMPPLLWQHDPGQPIGTFSTLREDEAGLYVEAGLLKNEVRQAAEAHAHLKAGVISGLSIGFSVVCDAWDREHDIRTLLEIDLWEVSLVTFPANDAARVHQVKAAHRITTIREFESFLRDEGGYSRAAARRIAERGFKDPVDPRDEDDGRIAALTGLASGLNARMQAIAHIKR